MSTWKKTIRMGLFIFMISLLPNLCNAKLRIEIPIGMRHKMDKKSRKQLDNIIRLGKSLEATLDGLPYEIRKQFEPLLNNFFLKSEKLLYNFEEGTLRIIEASLHEVDIVFKTNIERVDEVLQRNILDLEAMFSRLIHQTIEEADGMLQDNIQLLFNELNITLAQKAELAELIFARQGEEFMMRLSEYTEQTVELADQIFQLRIDQSFDRGENLITVLDTILMKSTENVADKIRKEVTHTGVIVEKFNRDFQREFRTTVRLFLKEFDGITDKQTDKMEGMLSELPSLVFAEAKIFSQNTSILIAKILLLAFMLFSLSVLLIQTAMDKVNWSPVIRGMTAVVTALCFTVLLSDTPLEVVFNNKKDYKLISSTSPNRDSLDSKLHSFYNDFQNDPFNQSVKIKGNAMIKELELADDFTDNQLLMKHYIAISTILQSL